MLLGNAVQLNSLLPASESTMQHQSGGNWLQTNFYFLRLSPDSVLLRHDHLEEPFSKQTVAHTKQSNPMILLHVGHCDRLLQDSAQMILSFSFTVSGEWQPHWRRQFSSHFKPILNKNCVWVIMLNHCTEKNVCCRMLHQSVSSI